MTMVYNKMLKFFFYIFWKVSKTRDNVVKMISVHTDSWKWLKTLYYEIHSLCLFVKKLTHAYKLNT